MSLLSLSNRKSKVRSICWYRVVLVLAFLVCILSFGADAMINSSITKTEPLTLIAIKVNQGDTIWSIAEKYANFYHTKQDIRVFITSIASINNLNKNYQIYPGQQLFIPVQCLPNNSKPAIALSINQ